jgi:protein-L-isoaspartate(D-aspartate) O-methyltransferase
MAFKFKLFLIIFVFFAAALGGEKTKKKNYRTLRKQMVEEQIFQRGITDKRLKEAFMNVERHLFVRPELRSKAYGNYILDIGEDQAVSEPYIVAIMTYVVGLEYDKKVLEIGTGSGYHSAILAELVKHVYTIERIESLAKTAKNRLDTMGYKNIIFKIGDGYEGWKEHAPFDAILVTCSEDHIPAPLKEQLAVGGRLIIPFSYAPTVKELILLEKESNGNFRKTHLIPVQAVPLIRGSVKSDE